MRRLLSLAAALGLPALVSAQCFETNFGTSIGSGDDSLLAVTPMNIVFPMGGIAPSYTHVQPNTNGLIYLTNGVAAVGGTPTGYGTTAAAMVTNLRGLAGQNPRIAVYWRDLNLTAANNAGVFVNNTLPGKCVVTWKNAVHFSQTTPIFTVQAQLWADGHVDMFYSGTTQDTAIVPICGVSAGNAIADPGATDLSVGAVGVSTSQIVYQTFATLNTFDLQNTTVSFVPNAGGGYDVLPNACVPAFHSNYGSGCYNAYTSFYENFATAASFDLGGTSLQLTNTGTGYVVTAGSASFVPPVSPTVLVLSDDSEAIAPALTTPFPYPGGSTSAFAVCSNGFISAATGNGTGFTPSPSVMLAAPQTGWWAQHDYNVAIVGSGQVKFEEIAGVAYVTWDGVWDFGGTTAANASNVQWQFDEATGNIAIVFGTMSTLGNGFLVGYSPGGASLDPGSRDLSATLPFVTSGADTPALSLAAAPAPVLGATVTYTLANIRAVLSISAIYVSFGQTAAVPLPSMGINSPGCSSYLDTNPLLGYGAASTLLLTNPTATMNVTIPNLPIWAGVDIYFQGASLSPAESPSGVIVSNGVRTRINSF
jgi:hypothetical protein